MVPAVVAGLAYYFVAGSGPLEVLPNGHRILDPFVVADLPGRGKGLLATRDIEQGELLIQESPLFIVPQSSSLLTRSLYREINHCHSFGVSLGAHLAIIA